MNLSGFVLNMDGVRANPEKTQAISCMPPPRNVKHTFLF